MRRLSVMPESLAIVKLDADAPVPEWLTAGFRSITRTPKELSIVCDAALVPDAVDAERGWRALEVAGPLALTEIGILASLAVPLRDANVSLFAISTFDTDYVLVRAADLEAALDALETAGWTAESR